MQKADNLSIFIQHGQYRDGLWFIAFHQMQCLRCQLILGNGLGIGRHQLAYRTLQKAHALAQATANIAIGEHALHDALLVYDGNCAQALIGDDKESILHRSIGQNGGVFVTLMHDVAHSQQQLATKASTGMENGELTGSEIVLFQESQG